MYLGLFNLMGPSPKPEFRLKNTEVQGTKIITLLRIFKDLCNTTDTRTLRRKPKQT